MKTKQPNLS
jgi:hypothetical protein